MMADDTMGFGPSDTSDDISGAPAPVDAPAPEPTPVDSLALAQCDAADVARELEEHTHVLGAAMAALNQASNDHTALVQKQGEIAARVRHFESLTQTEVLA